MKQPAPWRGLGLAACLLLAATGTARAERIDWSYSTFLFPGSVSADKPGKPGPTPVDVPPPPIFWPTVGTVSFGAMSADVTGTSHVLLGNVSSFSSSAFETPDKFTKQTFTMAVGIVDKKSNKNGLLTFNGTITGDLWANGSTLKISFEKPTQTLHLGQYYYRVSIDNIVPPGLPGTGIGAIGANVKVTHNPEPSTLILIGMVAPVLGVRYVRRRRRRRA